MAIPRALQEARARIEREVPPLVVDEPKEAAPSPGESEPAPSASPAAPALDENMFAVSTDADAASPFESEAPPPVATVVQHPATETSPAQPEPWEQRYRTLQGMFEKLKSDMAALQAKASGPAPLPKSEAKSGPTGFELALPKVDVDPEAAELYARSTPWIRKVAADVLAEATAPLLARLQALENDVYERVTTTQQALAGLGTRSFAQTLRAAVPDLDALAKDPKFRAWAAQKVPFSAMTVRERLSQAYKEQDTQTIAEIVGEFRKQGGRSAPAAADPAAFQQPRSATGGGAVPQPREATGKPKLAWSKRLQAQREFQAKRITWDEMQRIQALYNEAHAEGRVDYSS